MDFINWDGLKYGEKRRMLESFRRVNTEKHGDLFSAFDIETSALHPFTDWDDCPPSVCYIWQFHVEGFNPIYGRKLEAFVEEVLTALKSKYVFNCAVHNLSFEMQFLRPYIKDYVQKRKGKYDVFMRDPRTYQTVKINGVKLFCSAILSGKPLKQFIKDNNVPDEFQKLDGDDFDYHEIRTSDTVLTDDQLMYCRNDVVGLTMALRNLADAEGYKATDIPQTSTGFVRADVKKATDRGAKKWRDENDFTPFYMGDGIAWLFRKSFRGGNTHANRHCVGKWIEGVKSYDRTSSYPAVLMCYKFPRRLTGYYFEDITDDEKYDLICKSIAESGAKVLNSEEVAGGITSEFDPLANQGYLYHVVLQGVHIKKGYPVPYIPCTGSDKLKCDCSFYPIELALQKDNGRVLQADTVDMWVCSADMAIILGQYDIDNIDIKAALRFEMDYLPESFRALVKLYFEKKCTLQSGTIEYAQIKAKINALYGMFALDPFGVSFEFTNIFGDTPCIVCDKESSSELQMFPYQIGCWTTMLARWELERGIRCFNGVDEGSGSPEQFCYTDTDSIKYWGETPAKLTALIDELRAVAVENGVAVTKYSGKVKYLGSWDYEGEYTAFCTLGAKKYCVEEGEGQYEITVAGVNKKEGSKSIQTRDDFSRGKIFTGKLSPKYFDDENECSETLCQVEYKLDITDTFERMLEFYSIYGDEGIYNACIGASNLKGDC